MSIKTKEVKFASELDDVLVLIEEVIRVVKEKGEYTELMDELVSAITNVADIKEESEDRLAMMNTIGLRMSSITNIFVAK